jgi:hypothetical protein
MRPPSRSGRARSLIAGRQQLIRLKAASELLNIRARIDALEAEFPAELRPRLSELVDLCLDSGSWMERSDQAPWLARGWFYRFAGFASRKVSEAEFRRFLKIRLPEGAETPRRIRGAALDGLAADLGVSVRTVQRWRKRLTR